jgi:hypothetical protein
MPIKCSAGTLSGRREARKLAGSPFSDASQTTRSASFRLDMNVVFNIHKSSTVTPKVLSHNFLHRAYQFARYIKQYFH